MIGRFYTEEELRGAMVYDSEGLLYGEAGGLVLLDEGAFVEVYVKKKVGEVTIDVEKLTSNLARLGIRSEGATLAELVSLCRELGVDIPSRVIDREVSLLKARVSVEEILWLDSKNVEPFGELKVMLLTTPREAEFRGWRPRPPARWPKGVDVKGRPVFSISSGILGVVEGVVVGAGGVGLRITRSSGGREVRWLAFVTALKRRGQDKLAEKLSREIEPYSNPRLRGTDAERAAKLVEKLGSEEALGLLAEHTVESKDTVDIPWSSVLRVGDAVVTE